MRVLQATALVLCGAVCVTSVPVPNRGGNAPPLANSVKADANVFDSEHLADQFMATLAHLGPDAKAQEIRQILEARNTFLGNGNSQRPTMEEVDLLMKMSRDDLRAEIAMIGNFFVNRQSRQIIEEQLRVKEKEQVDHNKNSHKKFVDVSKEKLEAILEFERRDTENADSIHAWEQLAAKKRSREQMVFERRVQRLANQFPDGGTAFDQRYEALRLAHEEAITEAVKRFKDLEKDRKTAFRRDEVDRQWMREVDVENLKTEEEKEARWKAVDDARVKRQYRTERPGSIGQLRRLNKERGIDDVPLPEHHVIHHGDDNDEAHLAEIMEKLNVIANGTADFNPDATFHSVDTDHNGYIDTYEAEAMYVEQAKRIHPDMSEDDPVVQEEVRAMRKHMMDVSEADKNGDLLLSQAEFFEWIVDVEEDYHSHDDSEGWLAHADSTEFDDDEYFAREADLIEKFGTESEDDVVW